MSPFTLRLPALRAFAEAVRPLALLAGLALVPSAHAVYYTDLIGGGLGPVAPSYVPNDDGSVGPVAAGFSFDYFNNTYDSFFINNNGNVSFGSGFGTFTPQPLDVTSIAPTIAPYWADVDTRPMNGGSVYLRTDVADQVIVTWDQVGYFSNHTERQASFQLVFRGPDYVVPPGEGRIGFFYRDVEWETGDASGGSGGFGGVEATVGFGDGLAAVNPGEVSLTGSAMPGISQIVSNEFFWFQTDATGGILGGTQDTPIMPIGQPSGIPQGGWVSALPSFFFEGIASGLWVDPIPTDTFYFQTTDGSQFTSVGLPAGDWAMFEMFSDGLWVGSAAPGSIFNFGAPTANFAIGNIAPMVDASDPLAFPVRVFFDDPTGSFLMGAAPFTLASPDITPVPEAASFGLWGVAALLATVASRRRRRVLLGAN